MKKKIKTALSLLLAATMILGIAAVGFWGNMGMKADAVVSCQNGDIVKFGMYPQSKVTNYETTEILNNIEAEWHSYYYYSGDGELGSMKYDNYMEYVDVECCGKWYRGVRAEKYRPALTISASGGYQSENGYYFSSNYRNPTTYWFEYEPVKWRVIDAESGLLLSENIIDSQAFSNTVSYDSSSNTYFNDNMYYSNDYFSSSLENWMMDFDFEFYDYPDYEYIYGTIIENNSNDPSSEETERYENFYALSYDDVNNEAYGFNPSDRAEDGISFASGTDYALCQGLKVTDGISSWWLRTPDSSSDKAKAMPVSQNEITAVETYSTSIGVRPAVNVTDVNSLEKVIEPINVKSISFGSYPQTAVADEALLSELNSQTLDWVSYDYCSTDKETNTVITSDFMKYADITYEGLKYRAVTFSYYRPMMTSGELGNSASKQENYGYLTDTVYWFKYEPLNWYVLDGNEGFLFCDTIIDAQPFSSSSNNYESSTIREWLNKDFYNTAFTEAQKACIQTVRIEQRCRYNCAECDTVTTYDNAFLLSWDEWHNPKNGMYEEYTYMGEDGEPVLEHNYIVEKSQAKGTDYAKCQGLDKLGDDEYADYYCWWLRTPDCGRNYATGVTGTGTGYFMTSPRFTFFGIRPAMKIDLYEYFDTNDEYTVEIYTRDDKGDYSETPEKTETVNAETIPISEYVPEERALHNVKTEMAFEDDGLVLKVYYSSYGWLRWIDGWYGEMTESRQVKQGTYIYDYPYPYRDGYCFTGWETNNGEPLEVPFIMPDTDVELWARWEPIEFEVFFDANGGYFSNGEEMLSQRVYFESYIESSEVPTRDGYEFIGWATDPYGEPVDEYDMVLRDPYDSQTYYAVWRTMEFTLNYSFEGDIPEGVTAPVPVTAEYGTTVVTANIPAEVDGYTFSGWYVNGMLTSSFVMPANDVYLTGIWTEVEPERYTVTLDANGGEFADGSNIFVSDFVVGEQIVIPHTPEKYGYYFAGWADSNGNTDIPQQMPETDLTFTAVWQPATDIRYEVITYTMNVDGTYDAVSQIREGTMDEQIEIELPEIGEGFVINESRSILYGYVSPDALFEVYIDREKYTLTVNGESEEYYFGAEIKEPEIPEIEGLVFTGWADTQGNEIIFPYIMEAKDIELVPMWKVSEYSVKYIVANKSFEYKVHYGAEIPVPDISSVDGIEFKFWKNENGEKTDIPEVMPAQDLVFVAKVGIVRNSGGFGITATFDEDCFSNVSDISKVQLEVVDLGVDNDNVSGGEFIIKDENGKSYERIGFYDIKMTYEGSSVKFNEGKTVKIKLPVTGNEFVKQFVVIHRFTGGGRENFYIDNPSEKYENGYLTIEVGKFSEFEVYALTDKEPVTPGIKLVSAPSKTKYTYKTESMDLSGIAVEITKADGAKETVTDTSKMKVVGFDNTKIGTQTVTVECEGHIVQFEVSVSYAWWQWIIRILFLGFLWY